MKMIILVGLAILIAGCGRPFVVNVNSINQSLPLTTEKVCVLLSGLKNTTESDLQFQEFRTYVKRALEYKGYKIIEDVHNAKIVIYMSYAISNPIQETYSYNMPVYGQTGASSAYTSGIVNPSGIYSGTTTFTPSYGVTGYTTNVGTCYSYTREIVIEAWDTEKAIQGQQATQFWKTTITSSGSSGDLRKVFPVLLAAALDYIGENTKKQAHHILYENDKKVQYIKGCIEINDIKK